MEAHIQVMRTLIAALVVSLAAPAAAQDSPMLEYLLERFAERTERAMRDMVEEIEPELDALSRKIKPELEGFMAEVVPELRQLSELLGGIHLYDTPEILPNGDIIIRRRESAPPLPEGLPDRLIDPKNSIEL